MAISSFYAADFHYPYQNEGLNIIYNLLFCDDYQLYKSKNNAPEEYPWSVLLAELIDPAALLKIAENPASETRAKLLAMNLLSSNGHTYPRLELMGVIIEVGLEEGTDVLAAYEDGSARYINYSEKAIFWDAPTADSQRLIQQLFVESAKVVQQIGPWDKARLPQPEKGMIKLSFLVSDGLYFGMGPFGVLAKDPMGGPVIQAATALMQFLTEYKPA